MICILNNLYCTVEGEEGVTNWRRYCTVEGEGVTN